MISRRQFLGTAGIAILSRQAVAQTQKLWRIGYIAPGLPEDPVFFQTFMEGLRALGYSEGQNIVIVRPATDSRPLPTLAEELVREKVDVIVAPTTPVARAAKGATNSIPIVFTIVSDPIGSGLVSSFSHPGGNVTGMTDMGVDLVGKQLDLLKQVVPHLKRVGALGHPADKVWDGVWKEAPAAAHHLSLEISPVLVTTQEELETAFTGLSGRVQALLIAPQVFFSVHRKRLIELTISTRLPTIFERRAFVEAGALMSYGPNYTALFRKAARHVDKILQGASPTDLPVEQPTEYELVINLKTAKALRLSIPQSVLVRADEVIR
jgi:putative ABC transport system substrate-binding protein